mgnify:CR=1 FL=1
MKKIVSQQVKCLQTQIRYMKYSELKQKKKKNWNLCLLMDIFGLESCVMYHKDFSENIRTAFPKLKNEFLKMLGKEIL